MKIAQTVHIIDIENSDLLLQTVCWIYEWCIPTYKDNIVDMDEDLFTDDDIALAEKHPEIPANVAAELTEMRTILFQSGASYVRIINQ